MQIELINTGSELMLGRVLNTHQQWICRQLADAGMVVTRQVAVDDTAETIQNAVQEALERADLIITTGGLGPTSDDRTRDVIAQLLNRKLAEDAAILARIEGFFAARKRIMPASTRIQAMVPEGATVLMNSFGTAPGLVMEARSGHVLIMLPGPPRELRPMFTNQVMPLLAKRFPNLAQFVSLTLKTTGVGESVVEETIASDLQALVDKGLELGYCARVGEVDVRINAAGSQATSLVAQGETIIRAKLGAAIYGSGDDSLEGAVVAQLIARKETVATAESCTGGFISHRITNVPGASGCLWGGVVSYANDAKEQLLGVNHSTLLAHGAVSEATVREMAEGARRHFGTHYAIAVTGIAGPGGGTPEKPVGTVFIGVASPNQTIAKMFYNPFERETFKWVTSQQALNLLRLVMLEATVTV